MFWAKAFSALPVPLVGPPWRWHAGVILWRFFKSHEEQLYAGAEAGVSKVSQPRS
jgi:hypothetical protein